MVAITEWHLFAAQRDFHSWENVFLRNTLFSGDVREVLWQWNKSSFSGLIYILLHSQWSKVIVLSSVQKNVNAQNTNTEREVLGGITNWEVQESHKRGKGKLYINTYKHILA